MVWGVRSAVWRAVRRVGSRGGVGVRGMRIGLVFAMVVWGWAEAGGVIIGGFGGSESGSVDMGTWSRVVGT